MSRYHLNRNKLKIKRLLKIVPKRKKLPNIKEIIKNLWEIMHEIIIELTATWLEHRWMSVRLRTKWFWVRVQVQSVHFQISRLLRARSSLTFRQLQSVDSLWNAYLTWQEHTDNYRIFSEEPKEVKKFYGKQKKINFLQNVNECKGDEFWWSWDQQGKITYKIVIATRVYHGRKNFVFLSTPLTVILLGIFVLHYLKWVAL